MAGKRIDQRCSFCGKKKDQVRKLIAGPGVFICDQCVELANQILNAPPPSPGTGQGTGHWEATTGSTRPWWRRFFQLEVSAPV